MATIMYRYCHHSSNAAVRSSIRIKSCGGTLIHRSTGRTVVAVNDTVLLVRHRHSLRCWNENHHHHLSSNSSNITNINRNLVRPFFPAYCSKYANNLHHSPPQQLSSYSTTTTGIVMHHPLKAHDRYNNNNNEMYHIRWNSSTTTTPITAASIATSSSSSTSSVPSSNPSPPPTRHEESTGIVPPTSSPSEADDTTKEAVAPSTFDSSSSTDESTTTNATMRDKIRDRIQDTRTAAVAQMKEFRDHPAQSAKEGAKSFSGMLRKYGPIFIATYGCVYFTTLGLLFSGVQSGILDPLALFGYLGSHNPSENDVETATTVHLVVDWMMNHDITKPYAPYIEKNPAFANLAVAWIAVKFTEPVRLPIALGLTPRVSRFIGYTKEPPEEEDDKVSSSSTTTSSSSSGADTSK